MCWWCSCFSSYKLRFFSRRVAGWVALDQVILILGTGLVFSGTMGYTFHALLRASQTQGVFLSEIFFAFLAKAQGREALFEFGMVFVFSRNDATCGSC